MTPERKLKLHDELHEARLERRIALAAMNDARSAYLDRKATVRAATDTVEEILEEIETSKAAGRCSTSCSTATARDATAGTW